MTLDCLYSDLAGYGARLRAGGVMQTNTIKGRQGKSAAFRRAHIVGRLEFLGPFGNRADWRFSSKPERIQRLDRRRYRAKPASAP
jgi:hypothetical protein